jgi:hypothetical protein
MQVFVVVPENDYDAPPAVFSTEALAADYCQANNFHRYEEYTVDAT